MLNYFAKIRLYLLQLVDKLWYTGTGKHYERMVDMSIVENGIGKVDSVKFAAYLQKKALDSGKSVNVTKIQKWLYICYGLYFALYQEPLLNERPKAWEYGPVLPRVYSRYKKKGLQSDFSSEDLDILSQYDYIIKATLDAAGDLSASKLVGWTHGEGKAWDKTVRLEGKYAPMDNHDIYLDFKRFVNSDGQQE